MRSAEVLKAAEAAATTTTTTTTEEKEASPAALAEDVDDTAASKGGGRVDVLVDVRTGADYVVVPPVGNISGYEGQGLGSRLVAV